MLLSIPEIWQKTPYNCHLVNGDIGCSSFCSVRVQDDDMVFRATEGPGHFS